jgi:hypothetical protein
MAHFKVHLVAINMSLFEPAKFMASYDRIWFWTNRPIYDKALVQNYHGFVNFFCKIKTNYYISCKKIQIIT